MLAKIKVLLNWLELLSLVLFIETSGVVAFDKSPCIGIFTIAIGIILFVGLIVDYFIFKNKSSIPGKSFGNPILSIVLLIFSYISITDFSVGRWKSVFIIGCIMIAIDLILWFLDNIKK